MDELKIVQREGVIEFRSTKDDFAFLRLERLSIEEIENAGEQCEHESGFKVAGDAVEEIEGALDRLSELSDEEIEAQRPSWDNANPTLDDINAKHAWYAANPPTPCDPSLRCPKPATHLVTICDAPELILDPDTYFFCTTHAQSPIGSFVIGFA